ncbi:dihydropteroate synthase [Brachybacterium sp. EF45031]|uniref:dihydropteroate synthase n=1 Tax=Brachybacterium sillae TaxID=2810536 RepID=UPI00217DECB1|nr:dihydropteroate synthase [Brachybacterium sillae]MCS6712597.1 dihydropteroate synthase [Brachybacterium sillae]
MRRPLLSGPRRPVGLPEPLASLDRTAVMGILNVTPDSFSDGGLHNAPEAAVAHARLLRDQGADLIDLGGESTRPGAEPVDEEEELRRVMPVVRALVADGAVLSIDTMHAAVAEAVIAEGVGIINDVSGGLADPAMPATTARLRTRRGEPPVMIAMHWRGPDVRRHTTYTDVAREVREELGAALRALVEAGVERERLVADPGLGFSKAAAQDWELLAHWDELEAHDLPVLIGASRKRSMGSLGVDRDQVTAAVSMHSALHGAWAVRVHEAAPSAAAARAARALAQAGSRRG